MSDDPSPWPERRRTQALLFAVGAACLLPSAVHFGGLAELGGTFVVGTAAVGSALLIYGLLGWGGQWAAPDEEVVRAAPDHGGEVSDVDDHGGEASDVDDHGGEASDVDDHGDEASDADDDAATEPADDGNEEATEDVPDA